jgi:hypothetical protein
LAFAFALLLPASLALADGDGPSRKMTGPEAAAFNALKSAVQASLPRAPANYALKFGDGYPSGVLEIFASIKPDQMARLQFSATYTLSQEFRDGQQQNLFMDRAKGTPGQQARLAVLDARDEELTQARNATRDRAEKDRIKAEKKAVQGEANALRDQIMAEYTAWVASGGAMEAMQSATQSAPPREFTIRVLVNQDVSVSGAAAPVKIAGAPVALEQSEGCAMGGDNCVTALLGPFKRDGGKRGSHWLYQLHNANLGVPTKPRGMMIVVAGPKQHAQRVRELAAQVDYAKLKALLPQ